MELRQKQIDLINEWTYNARKLGWDKRDVKRKIKNYPRAVRKRILKIFKSLDYIEKENKWYNDMKGGYKKMVTKSWKAEEDEEEDEEPVIEDDEEMEDLDSDEGDVKRGPGKPKKVLTSSIYEAEKRQKTPAVYKQPDNLMEPKGKKDWLIRTIPQSFELIDPINGTILLNAGSYEELMLKLQVMSTQYAVESAKNTR